MRLVVGDSFRLKAARFEGIVTDPPFRDSIASNCPVQGGLGAKGFSNERFMALAARVTGPDSVMAVVANFPNAAELHALSKAPGCPWRWVATQVWDKRPTRTWVAWSRPLKCLEYVVWFVRGKGVLDFRDGSLAAPSKRKSFGGAMKAQGGRRINKARQGMFEELVGIPTPRKRQHPTQKPAGLGKMLARVIGSERRVLDPFCGSGALLGHFTNGVGIDVKPWWEDPV